MNKSLKLIFVAAFCLLITISAVLPTFAADDVGLLSYGDNQITPTNPIEGGTSDEIKKESLSLGGGAGIEYVSGVTTWADIAAEYSTVYLTDVGLVFATGCVIVDEYEEPVKPSDVISASKSYERREDLTHKCKVYSAADSSAEVYWFWFVESWTYYDLVNWSAENGGSIKIDVIAGDVYYRESGCACYPFRNGIGKLKDTAAVDDTLTFDAEDADSIVAHVVDGYTVTRAPTCTSEGEAVETCKNCGKSTTYTLSMIDHDYKLTGDTRTCTDSGILTYTCTQCGGTKKVEAAATGHVYKGISIVCERCGHWDLLRRSGIDSSDGGDSGAESSGNILGGIFDGISDKVDGVTNKVDDWFKNLEKGFKTAFSIALGACGIILICSVGYYVVRFVRALLPSSRNKKRRR